MSAPAEAEAARLADQRITAERDEVKYFLPPQRFHAFAGELTQRLTPHRFTGEGANGLPEAHHFVTTIYFDTASRSHFRAASTDFGKNVKIRAKEYYDLHPSLAELATDPSQIVRYQPWLWFEMKRRDGDHVSKRRFRLPKRDVAAFFAEGRTPPEALPAARPGLAAGSAASDADSLAEIVAYCRDLDEPLRADCLVNYRRLSWQADDGTLRITMDLGPAFYAAPADLWTRDWALVRGTLGPARGAEGRVVVEIKRYEASPAWLEEALRHAGAAPVSFSKFVAASRAVHGDG